MRRHWLQLNTQGIARRSSMRSDDVARRRAAADVERRRSRRSASRRGTTRRSPAAVDELAIGATRERGQLVERSIRGGASSPSPSTSSSSLRGSPRRALRGCGAPSVGFGVLRRDHLALLGDPERARDAARRLGEDGLVARAAAAADRAAAAVEEAQADAASRVAATRSTSAR